MNQVLNDMRSVLRGGEGQLRFEDLRGDGQPAQIAVEPVIAAMQPDGGGPAAGPPGSPAAREPDPELPVVSPNRSSGEEVVRGPAENLPEPPPLPAAAAAAADDTMQDVGEVNEAWS